MNKPELYQNLKLLVVDDHRIMRTLVRQNLQSFGVTNINTAHDGVAALEEIRSAYGTKNAYHAVFLDWKMPEMDGIDVLKTCRADNSYDKTAFVMLTAEQEQGNILEALSNGATSYMVKPVSNDTVGKNLQKIVKWLIDNNGL